jgi:hypothetical protein
LDASPTAFWPTGWRASILLVHDWKGGHSLSALPLPAACRVLETQQEVVTRRAADGIVVTLPEARTDDRVTVLALDVKP